MDNVKTLLIIPAYNEEATIGFVVGQSKELVRRGLVADFLVICDGSTDRTAELAREAGATVLPLAKNHGKGAAILQGLLWAKTNGAGTVLMADADVVYGFTSAQVSFMLSELEADSRSGKRAMMTVYPTLEQKSDAIINAEENPPAYSGFRAIRLEGINFLFKQSNGVWDFSSSEPAKRFFDAASGYGLETALNQVFLLRTNFLPNDHGNILLKPAFRNNKELGRVQNIEIHHAGSVYISRRNQADLLRMKRKQNRQAPPQPNLLS
jgi:glycosyltransferase involved in cell wall biosynthesis